MLADYPQGGMASGYVIAQDSHKACWPGMHMACEYPWHAYQMFFLSMRIVHSYTDAMPGMPGTQRTCTACTPGY